MAEEKSGVEPALLPDEWRDLRFEPLSNNELVIHDDGDGLEIVIYADSNARAERERIEGKYKLHHWAPNDRHGLAALALYGQPFGFTREDVRMLRETADRDDAELRAGNNARTDIDSEACRLLADRIEALLPPEK